MFGQAKRFAVLVLLGLQVGAATAGAQQPQAHADLVVDLGDGRVAVRQVTLTEPFTGSDLLQASGLDLELAGGAVCRIGPAGCPGTDCFCECTSGDSCRFWHYSHMTTAGAWEEAATGASEASLADGAVDGWAWSDARAPITATTATRSALRGMAWLQGRQLANGSVGDHAGLTSELVLAAVAVGVPVTDLNVSEEVAGSGSGASALGFLQRVAADYSSTSVAAAGKLATAASAGGLDPHRIGGIDVVARIRQWFAPSAGTYGSGVWDQSWAILGLASSGESVPENAAAALAAMAAPGGGWGGAEGATPDPDSTGLALQALAAAGRTATDPAVQAALAYLRQTQNEVGGWGHEGGATNANSTAYAIQGLIAVGAAIDSTDWQSPSGTTPTEAIIATQRPEGRFEHDSAPADLVATLQAVPAVAGRPSGRRGPMVAGSLAVDRTYDDRTADGGFEGFQPGATIDAVIGLVAHGADPEVATTEGKTAAEYLHTQAAEYAARGPASAGKLALAAAALGENPRTFGGTDLVDAIEAAYSSDTGAYGPGGTWDSAYALLGLVAAGEPVPPEAYMYLLSIASAEGGWGFEASSPDPDPDSTGLALQALAAVGVPSDSVTIRKAVELLHRRQLPDGSFPGYDGAASSVSTAAAIVGLRAAGQAIDGAGWRRDWRYERRGPMDALLAMQTQTGGFIGYGGAEDPSATYAALLATSGLALPVSPPPAVYLPFATQGR